MALIRAFAIAAFAACVPVSSSLKSIVGGPHKTADILPDLYRKIVGPPHETSTILPDLYAHRPPAPGPIPKRPSRGLTVVIMGYTDKPSMTRSLCHHARLAPLVEEVLLVWNDNETDLWTEPVDCGAGAGKTASIRVLQQKYNTLLNRYIVWPEIKTEGVLLLDDDVLIDGRHNLTRMYRTWRRHPTQVVGLWGNCPYKQDGKFFYVYRNCSEHYSITTGQGNMVHRNYMQMFMAQQPLEMLEHMYTQYPTCEDVALSFLASNQTGLPPLVTNDVWKDTGDSVDRVEMHWSFGTREHWLELRGACMDKFVKIYGHDPLAPTLPFE